MTADVPARLDVGMVEAMTDETAYEILAHWQQSLLIAAFDEQHLHRS
jgi:hypothetical protein